MITLQTPGTGFDDFESRIALGLCRVALDCVEPEQIVLEESFDRYLVHIDIDETKKEELAKSLTWWCLRTLSDQNALLRILGFRPKGIDIQTEKISKHGLDVRNKQEELLQIYSNLTSSKTTRKGSHDLVCGHKKFDKFSALLAFSSNLGSPPIRNNPVRTTNPPDVCIYCGSLSILGTTSFQINMRVSNKKQKEIISFIPRFHSQTKGSILSQYISTIKNITTSLNDIPSISATLTLLSSYPHLSRVISEDVRTIFISRAKYINPPGVWRYNFSDERNVSSELLFLGNSPYNVALAQRAYRQNVENPELIGLLTKTLQFKENHYAVAFYREYVSATEGKNLIYKETTKYIAKEVLNMDEKLINDTNIGAVASMLKYFVRERRFGYVDNLRSSRSPEEFEKHLLSAQRDAASIYYSSEMGKQKPYMPNETNFRETLRALNGQDFERIKTLICLLAFSFSDKKEE